ncbi:MAG TPA: hypothetical protein VFN67_21945 [Polyangiales bacterium]|nr:hypothetical protein [Polyangiales bacterium]
MSHLEPSAPPLSSAAVELDPELAALPAPPKAQRLWAMTLMAGVVAMAIGLATSVRSDMAYALLPDRAELLGEAVHLDPANLPSNAYVVVRGTPMLSNMVRFESGLFGAEHVVFPLAGQRNVFVQVSAESLRDPRSASSTEFAGRMVTFGELGGRFRVVRQFLAARMDLPVNAETFLVVADDPPSGHAWSLFFGAFCVAIVALNVWLFSRWFKPIRSTQRVWAQT